MGTDLFYGWNPFVIDVEFGMEKIIGGFRVDVLYVCIVIGSVGWGKCRS